jgi:hypothetical protein
MHTSLIFQVPAQLSPLEQDMWSNLQFQQRQEDLEFKVSLGYLPRPCLKKQTTKKSPLGVAAP